MGDYSGKWLGGRVRSTRDGDRYVLERQIDGKRVRVTLKSTSLKQALAELALFNREPRVYMAGVEAQARAGSLAVTIDELTVQGYLDWLKSKDRGEKYRADCLRYLNWWDLKLKQADLRTVTLRKYQTILRENAEGAALHRIAAIKSFCTYLRVELGTLTTAEDATLSLQVPQATPAKDSARKGFAARDLEQVYQHLQLQEVRDLFLLQAKTGMHGSEIRRLVAEGEVIKLELKGCEIAGTMRFKHKNRGYHIQSLDRQALAAAQRLKARGTVPVERWVNTQLDRAVEAAAAAGIKLPQLRPGPLRHTFVTLARSGGGRLVQPPMGGVQLSQIAEIIGHKDKRTTQKFYDGTEVPPMLALPLQFEHPQDPALPDPDPS
jgi:integrase